MSAKSDPLILALAKISRELPRAVDAAPTLENKLLVIQHARDTLRNIEQKLGAKVAVVKGTLGGNVSLNSEPGIVAEAREHA